MTILLLDVDCFGRTLRLLVSALDRILKSAEKYTMRGRSNYIASFVSVGNNPDT